MRLSTVSLLAAAVASATVSAAPFRRDVDDITGKIVRFAKTLETLQLGFYTEANSKFHSADYSAAGFKDPSFPVTELNVIETDEQAHGVLIDAVLAQLNLEPIVCGFDFTSVLTDVPTLLGAARKIEEVGVSAVGGFVQFIDVPKIRIGATTIDTNEARHQSIVNILNGQQPVPQAFDILLSPGEVLTLVKDFFNETCDVGFTPNTELTVTNTGTITTGTQLTFSSSALSYGTDTPNLFCQIIFGDALTATVLSLDHCYVPSGISGPAYIFVTESNEPLKNDVLDRQNQSVYAGPQLIFVD